MKDRPTFKQKVYGHYNAVVNSKVILLEKMLADLIESTKNETKSSAGDKYETGRAMLQIEQDNVRKQLKDALEQKAIFGKIDGDVSSLSIVRGCLVKTNNGYLFLSIALGKAVIDGLTVTALSPLSPLGNKLLGLKPAESIEMNGTKYTIEGIE